MAAHPHPTCHYSTRSKAQLDSRPHYPSQGLASDTSGQTLRLGAHALVLGLALTFALISLIFIFLELAVVLLTTFVLHSQLPTLPYQFHVTPTSAEIEEDEYCVC